MMQPVNWSQTYTGAAFDYDNLDKHYYDVEDFAHALSLLCRYNGHCTRFYSVAEHLVRCSFAAPDEFKFEALMHDASEAYLSDMPRPLKNLMPEYRALEKKVEQAICNQFNLPFPMSPEVKEVDNRMLLLEKELIMSPPSFKWETYGVTPYPVGEWDYVTNFYPDMEDWRVAKSAFMRRFEQLRP
jgi:hypothetical protein